MSDEEESRAPTGGGEALDADPEMVEAAEPVDGDWAVVAAEIPPVDPAEESEEPPMPVVGETDPPVVNIPVVPTPVVTNPGSRVTLSTSRPAIVPFWPSRIVCDGST